MPTTYWYSKKDEYVASFLFVFKKIKNMPKVFLLMNTFKYVFVCCQHIYAKILSSLPWMLKTLKRCVSYLFLASSRAL